MTGDEDSLYLTGALADFVDLHIAVQACHRRLLHEAQAAMDLHSLVSACGGHLGSVELRHGGIWSGALAGVDRGSSPPRHEPCEFNLGAHVRQFELCRLKGRDGHSELATGR